MSPLPEDGDGEDAPKNEHAQALGRLGGSKGGAARAASLTPARRSAIAGKAAEARWAKARAEGRAPEKPQRPVSLRRV